MNATPAFATDLAAARQQELLTQARHARLAREATASRTGSTQQSGALAALRQSVRRSVQAWNPAGSRPAVATGR